MARRVPRQALLVGLVVAASALVLASCGGGTTLAGDGAAGDGAVDDGRGSDAGGGDDSADDAGATDGLEDDGAADVACDREVHWELAMRGIESIELVDVTPGRYLSTERLRIEARMRSACERLGRVDVEVAWGDATDLVTITAWAWVPRGVDCPPSAPLFPWNVVIPGRSQNNLRVIVVDGESPDGGTRLEYGRELGCSGMPDCSCFDGVPAGTVPEGGECRTDCSCIAGLSCLGSYGVGGPYWACARPCNDFLDCGDFEICQEPVPDGMAWVCAGPADQCSDERPCPEGFECVRDATDAPNRCEDRRPWGPVGAPCDCDAPCGAVGHCILSSEYSDQPRCAMPCLRDVNCAPGASWFCSWDNTCQFVDGFF